MNLSSTFHLVLYGSLLAGTTGIISSAYGQTESVGGVAASIDSPANNLPLAENTKQSDALPATTFAFGAGVDHLPKWQGSAKNENRGIPYIDINWRDQVEFSTVKGLIIDVLHGQRWHGGLIGTMVWGRSRKDLGSLDVPTLQNTVQGGLFLEYALAPEASLGVRWRHDLQDTGVAYGEVYGELELPKVGYLEHDLRLSLEAMNGRGMRRFFGLSAEDAARLGVASYTPGAGLSRTAVSYEGFLPTSKATGIAFSAIRGRLSSNAANSPLVRNFGSATQKEVVAAFVYHF